MKIVDSMKLVKKYSACKKCGNRVIGNGEGTITFDEDYIQRTCKCGWSVTIDKRIKVIASVTKSIGRKTEGIYEVTIDGESKHKHLPANELKELSRVKHINQLRKVEVWLNTTEGRKWAIETPHVTNY